MAHTEVPEIDLAAARALLDAGGATFVDVRDPDSFHTAHIPGAEHLSDRTVRTFVANADPTRPVVVYCYHGYSSQGATMWLLAQGFADVRSLTGGFTAWQGIHPVE